MNIPTPAEASFGKLSAGITDVSISNGTYKFMGCSVLSISMTLGFNGTASSLTINLVEDTESGDSFVEPIIPSLWAFSLPKGGVGQPVIYPSGTSIPNLNPDGFAPANVPFYFTGICTNFRKGIRDLGGRTISVTLADSREVLTGVQCLMNGFALSQNVGTGTPRYSLVDNVIDVFGYFDYGMESNRNEYGMEWVKIREVLEAVRVTIHDVNFEFIFTGEAFTDVPEWYRLDDNIIDIVGLAQKVVQDAGSDLVIISRKMDEFTAVVEFRAIKRTNTDIITKSELQTFVDDRTDIVENFNFGREYRNEPTSSIIVGGMKNSNYVAYPSEYKESIHLTSGKEDYNAFPSDIKVRLFGGPYEKLNDISDGSPLSTSDETLEVNSGAIYPFWGFTPDDYAYPLIEPFLPLDHIVFDKTSESYANLSNRVPTCKVGIDTFSVRSVSHTDVFLDGDGDSDQRPFAFLEEYTLPSMTDIENNVDTPVPSGYTKGLPLNTEVLRAALSSKNTFYGIYSIHYPDIADALGFPRPNFKPAIDLLNNNATPDAIQTAYGMIGVLVNANLATAMSGVVPGSTGAIPESSFAGINNQLAKSVILDKFCSLIYEHVRQYALDHMGRKFIVCLPRSEIMNRIWQGLPVPTNLGKPEIEYVVDQKGYWENLPVELDGILAPSGTSSGGLPSSSFGASEEQQIRRKFMSEDGRFYAMAAIDWQPTGNINFNSNGENRAMFQDLPTSEFRPNKLASGNPTYILCSCNVNQLVKRPDLALVELPSAIEFDPVEMRDFLPNGYVQGEYDEFLGSKDHIVKYLWYFVKRDDDLRAVFKKIAEVKGTSFYSVASEFVSKWADMLKHSIQSGFSLDMGKEIVMDLKGVVIPLTSTWVSYGPWYATYSQAKGMVKVETDESLVPWNFERPPTSQPWYTNLDAAGFERLARTISDLEYVDSATIVAAGFPEYGPAAGVGFNSNLTGISVDFGIGGVKTTYSFSTYSARPGTFRKSEYDNVSRARVDTREKLPDTENFNIISSIFPAQVGANRYQY